MTSCLDTIVREKQEQSKTQKRSLVKEILSSSFFLHIPSFHDGELQFSNSICGMRLDHRKLTTGVQELVTAINEVFPVKLQVVKENNDVKFFIQTNEALYLRDLGVSVVE